MSPLPLIDVQPEVFEAASKVMGQSVAGQIASAQTALQDSLAGTGAMAGTDPGGSSWARAYDPAVSDTIAAITDLANACSQLAALLEQTGFNHGLAESASDPTRAVPSPADTTRYTVQRSVSCAAPPPPAAGGSEPIPTGWGLIGHLVGYAWPNGHQDRLRTAADAWSSAATDLDWASYAIDEAVTAISSQRSPEVDDAAAVVRGMKQHIQDVAAACRTLATGCSDYAAHLDAAHRDIEHELVSLLEWTAGIQAAGGLFSVITVGLSEAGAQAAEAARIAATATRVGTIIARLIDLATTTAETVATVTTKIADIAHRLKIILGARLSEATTTLVARLPTLADDTGAISLARLGFDAETSAAAKAIAESRRIGKEAEGLIPGAGNTKRIYFFGGRYRVPDILNTDAKVLGEVKNVKYQHLSSQLREYVSWARSQIPPYKVYLYVRADGGTALSGPLAQAVRDGQITLKAVLPK